MAAIGASGGIALLKINGTQYQLRGSFKVRIGGIQRSGIAGADGVHGWNEKYEVPGYDADIGDSGGLSLQMLQAITGATITLELHSGKAYALHDAFLEGPLELDGVEGKFSAKFGGSRLLEITA